MKAISKKQTQKMLYLNLIMFLVKILNSQKDLRKQM